MGFWPSAQGDSGGLGEFSGDAVRVLHCLGAGCRAYGRQVGVGEPDGTKCGVVSGGGGDGVDEKQQANSALYWPKRSLATLARQGAKLPIEEVCRKERAARDRIRRAAVTLGLAVAGVVGMVAVGVVAAI